MNCKICSHEMSQFSRANVLNKYDVAYFRCPRCGSIQTEEPYWLDEAYSSAISELDLGSVSRAVDNSKLTESLLVTSFDCNAQFVDYGAGYGILVRMMRDRGFDFYFYDTYADNLFAKGFEAEEPRGQYELLTAFEVFEHLVDPLKEIDRMTQYSRNLFFSTLLIPPNVPKPGEWWYYSFELGQHLTLYTRAALEEIARKFNLHLATDGVGYHLLSSKKVPQRRFSMLMRRGRMATLTRHLLRRRLKTPSLLMDDFRRVTGWNV